jgi:hypothetical protein
LSEGGEGGREGRGGEGGWRMVIPMPEAMITIVYGSI